MTKDGFDVGAGALEEARGAGKAGQELPGLVAQGAQVGLADFPGSTDLTYEELGVGVGDEGIVGRGTTGPLDALDQVFEGLDQGAVFGDVVGDAGAKVEADEGLASVLGLEVVGAVAVGVGGAIVSSSTVRGYGKIEWVLSHWGSSWSEWRVASGELDEGRGQGAIAPAWGGGEGAGGRVVLTACYRVGAGSFLGLWD